MNRLIAVVGLVFAVACGPPNLEEVRTKTAENLAALVQETYDAVEASTNNSPAITRLYAGLNLTLVDLGKTPQTRPTIPARTGYQATFDAYKQYLTDRVFLSENVEGTGGGNITFLVNGKRFCTDPMNPSANSTATESCAKSVDDAQIRIVASGNPKSTLVLQLELGPQRRRVATLILETDRAIELQFHSAAYLAWANDLVATSPMAQATSPYAQFKLEGDFSYRLEKLGPKSVTMSYSTLTDLRYEYTSPDGVTRRYTMAARKPMYELTFDGPRAVHATKLDLGTASYSGLWSDYSYNPDGGSDATPLAATMQGFTAELTTDASPHIAKGTFSLGSGPSTVTYGGAEVVSFSLAHPVSYTIDTGSDGRLRLDSSELDATASFHLSKVPGTTVDSAYADETYRVRFLGPSPAMKLATVDSELGIKVVSGTFGVEAQRAARSVTATAGLCLVTPKMPPMNEVPLLKVLVAVPCN